MIDWTTIRAAKGAALMIVLSAVALGVLLGLQFVVGNLLKRVPGVTRLIDERPLLPWTARRR